MRLAGSRPERLDVGALPPHLVVVVVLTARREVRRDREHVRVACELDEVLAAEVGRDCRDRPEGPSHAVADVQAQGRARDSARGLHDHVEDPGLVRGRGGEQRARDERPRLVAPRAEARHMVAGDKNNAFNAAVFDFLARHVTQGGVVH